MIELYAIFIFALWYLVCGVSVFYFINRIAPLDKVLKISCFLLWPILLPMAAMVNDTIDKATE